jgi:hypothetical protein
VLRAQEFGQVFDQRCTDDEISFFLILNQETLSNLNTGLNQVHNRLAFLQSETLPFMVTIRPDADLVADECTRRGKFNEDCATR